MYLPYFRLPLTTSGDVISCRQLLWCDVDGMLICWWSEWSNFSMRLWMNLCWSWGLWYFAGPFHLHTHVGPEQSAEVYFRQRLYWWQHFRRLFQTFSENISLYSGYWRTERSRGVYDSALYKSTFSYFTLLTYLLNRFQEVGAGVRISVKINTPVKPVLLSCRKTTNRHGWTQYHPGYTLRCRCGKEWSRPTGCPKSESQMLYT